MKLATDYSIEVWMEMRVKLLSLILENKSEELMSIRYLAIKMKVPQNIIETLVEDQHGLELMVGVSSGGGIFSYEKLGDCLVDFYDEDGYDLLSEFSNEDNPKIQFMINHLNVKNYTKDKNKVLI